MKIGIDRIAFATSNQFVDMAELAHARHEDPNKYLIGIGQKKMAVIPPTQDIVTLAASAAKKVLGPEERDHLGMIMFATESAVDNSKSAAAPLIRLLDLDPHVRVAELKQACYTGTAGLQLAKGQIALHPEQVVLVIAADIARYGLDTPGEPTQGGGAVAMTVRVNPRILALEDDAAVVTKDIMDFWRPFGCDAAFVDGKYSTEVYLDFLADTFAHYQKMNGRTLDDFAALLFHLPFTKLGLKGLRQLIADADPKVGARLAQQFEAAREYGSQVGNLYTGSLYLSLISLLENSTTLRAGNRIGLYSYGSGAEGEFYSGILQPGFAAQFTTKPTGQALASRKQVSVPEYEKLYDAAVHGPAECVLNADDDPADFVFTGVHNHIRQYEYREN